MRQYSVVISLSFLNHDGEAFPEKKSPRTSRGLGTSKTAKTLQAILSLIFGLKLKCRQIVFVLNEKSSQLVIGWLLLKITLFHSKPIMNFPMQP